MSNVLSFLNRLGMARVAAMAVVAVMMLAFFAFLSFRVTAPQMAPLYTGLSFDDSAAIVSELQTLNINYQLRGEGEAILVPRDQITSIRMTLAESGLPARGQVGYEIFDQQSTLGATSFVQNINQLRALEGELARTITSLARVRAARVHLVLPERELFRREAKDPTASIVLEVRGALSAGEIRAIQHLTATAIDGLSPNRVSIVDTEGQLLASGTVGDDDEAMAAMFAERTLAFENRLRTRLEDILSNVVGAGRARVQVSAELDTSRSTVTRESYDPNGQVVRSSQTRELEDAATGPAADSSSSVANELPGAAGTTATTSGGSSERSATTEETINYEIPKTTTTEINEAGAVRRLSVAVVVDGTYQSDANGNSVYQPRSEDDLARIETLVQSAIGFDPARGDQIQVVNMQFAARPDLTIPDSEPGFFNFTRDDLFSVVEMLVTLLIAVALVFFVMRPLVKRVLAPETEPLALPQASAVPDADAGDQESGPQALIESELRQQGESEQWMEQARSMGEAKFQTLQQVGSLIEERPKQASTIIRDWLNQAA